MIIYTSMVKIVHFEMGHIIYTKYGSLTFDKGKLTLKQESRQSKGPGRKVSISDRQKWLGTSGWEVKGHYSSLN